MQIYLSYSKPPVLDMKWENRDANVVEEANIPKFSKLDNIGTSLRLFELFFVWVLATSGFMVMERKQTLVSKLLMKHFAYSRLATA